MSSISPSPIIPTFSQPSQNLHKYKSYQPKLFPVEPRYQHMKNARELVTKVFPVGWDFMPEDQNKNNFFLFLLTLDQSFCLLPLANMTQSVKELLSPNAQLKMFFPWPSGSITLGKGDNYLIPLFLKLTIILIIRKPSITLSSFRIITTSILGFSPLIKFMHSNFAFMV